MRHYELLLKEAGEEGVDVITYNFSSQRIYGLYYNKFIALSNKLKTHTEKACVLAEELGHHYTTVGDITDCSNVSNRKQEYRARQWAYDKLIGLRGIIDAYEHGCTSAYEMAEFLDVTEEFLQEALKTYKSKYGCYTTLDNYIIYFEPSIGVLEML